MEYDNEVYSLVCEIKEYMKEAQERNYMETIIDYDLKKIVGRTISAIVEKEEEYWHERWDRAVEDVHNVFY